MIARSVAEVLDKHVRLDLEGIDRLYLNAYQPLLQSAGGVVHFLRRHRGAKVASTALMAPMTRGFVRAIEDYARGHGIAVVRFAKGQRKDAVTQERVRRFHKPEGVVYIGVAQERFSAFRMSKRRNPATGASYPWLFRSTVMCNQYYFYLVDDDFGPLFIKFSSYFPYTARVCLNGHEYAKRQLDKAGIAYEPLDNGVAWCADPARLQQILDDLDAARIEAVVRKWLARLPYPFAAAEGAAGYRYQLSVLQAEFARTQVLDRPLSGRLLFEEIIRENLDLGRPDEVSLIFSRRITKRTPGRFRTRVITAGVLPALQVGYKASKIKQYLKEGRALRTETTINNSRDFGIGRRLHNLPALRAVGFAANRRLLELERLSQDCLIGHQLFERVIQPGRIDQQRIAALRFGDRRVMALLQALCHVAVLPDGFSNATLRHHVAGLMAGDGKAYEATQMTYDLRRLRLRGLIERLPGTLRYRLTEIGQRVCLFFTKLHARLIRPGLGQIIDPAPQALDTPLARAMNAVSKAVDDLILQAKMGT